MHGLLQRLREPMTLAGLFTLLAVALSLQFVTGHRRVAAIALLALFTGLYLLLTIGPHHWRRSRHAALLLMPACALLLAWFMPRIGTAQVLLVIWTACACGQWSVRQAVGAVLVVNVAFCFLLQVIGFDSPLIVVLINLGFQALAGLCVLYAVSAERSRDQLALVNADLLATRALLADSIRDAERLRMARELHDVAGHKLTAMRLNLRVLAADPVYAQREELRIAEQLSGELLADIRNVVQALRNEHGLDLETALRALAAPLPRPVLVLRIDDDVRVTAPDTAEALLRLVQEALTNAARHADANRLSVHLHHEGTEVVMHIEDDGRIKGSMREGNGIAGMRERIADLHGRLELGTTAHGGLRIDARLPA